jgi:hypothetical protein
MNKKSVFLIGAIVFATLGSILVYSNINAPLPSVTRPLLYNIDPKIVTGARTIDEIKGLIISSWGLPQANYDVKVSATEDLQYERTTWLLKFYEGGSYILSAQVNAKTGQILSIADHRYSGTRNNVDDVKDLLSVTTISLARMGVSVDALPSPTIIEPVQDSATSNMYTVMWDQYYKGVPVNNGFIRVIVDAEYLKPIVFTNGLKEVGDIDVYPTVSEAQALAAAGEYLKTGMLTSKGYSGCKLGAATLCITRPDYDPYNNRVYTPALNPCLAWRVDCTDQDSSRVDIVIDAHSNKVVSITETL